VIAGEENRTTSELLREALRFYVDTREVRQAAMRDRVAMLIDDIQGRIEGVPPREIRKVVREAVEAARRGQRRATA
jgi:predicted transcriptional regulator